MRERPKFTDEAIKAAAVERLLPRVREWVRSGNGDDAEANIRRDLLESFDVDGYHFARDLEQRCHWEVDAELVELLDDGAALGLFDALRDAEREWVKETGEAPALGIGGRCRFTQQGKTYDGSVIGIEDHGYYRVFSVALGHVPSGKIGTQAVYVAWEHVTPILPEDPA